MSEVKPTTRDIDWLAGFLEGEGCFSIHNKRSAPSPSISFKSTDYDVARKVANMLDTPLHGPELRPRAKPIWQCHCVGTRAAEWMMTLWILMGKRRRERIKEILTVWRQRPTSKLSVKKNRNRFI